MLKNIIKKYKSRGLSGVVSTIKRRLLPPKIKSYEIAQKIVSSGSGFEIGGSSFIFTDGGLIPLYKHINSLDNCNFSGTTVWEGDISKKLEYKYHKSKPIGRQYILEATDLKDISDEKYDFVLSSHMIEHTANPIKTLKEWLRIIKADGHLVLVIPHKDGTFDHKRPTTTVEHMIEDYKNGTDEYDLTHLDEILEYHDLKLDPDAGTFEEFKTRSLKNYENRCLHQHTFTAPLVAELMDYLQVSIEAIESIAPTHILVLVKKVKEKVDNRDILNFVNSSSYDTPFKSDKNEV